MLSKRAMGDVVCCAAVLAALVAGGCGGEPEGARNEGASAVGQTGSVPTDQAPPVELTDEAIRERAVATAEDLGEANPTDIAWVRSTRGEAARLMSGSELRADEDGDAPVIVVQAQGSFTVQGEGGVPDEAGSTAPPPRGTAFTLLLDAESGEFRGLGVTPEAVSLATLGDVHRI